VTLSGYLNNPLVGLFSDSASLYAGSSAGSVQLAWSTSLVVTKPAIPTMTPSISGWGTVNLNFVYNSAPVSRSSNVQVTQYVGKNFTLYTFDADNNQVNIVVATTPANMTLYAGNTLVAPGSILPSNTSFYVITDRYYYNTSVMTYTVTDGCEISTVYNTTIDVIHVNSPPVSYNASYNISQGSVQVFNFTSIVVDPDNDTPLRVQISSISPPGALLSSNGVSIGLNSVVGLSDVIRFTPPARFFGPAQISFVGQDPSNAYSNTSYISVNVTFVDTPPTLYGPLSTTCLLGQSCTFYYNVTDPDLGDLQTVNITYNGLTLPLIYNQTITSGATTVPLPAVGSPLNNLVSPAVFTISFALDSNFSSATPLSFSVQHFPTGRPCTLRCLCCRCRRREGCR